MYFQEKIFQENTYIDKTPEIIWTVVDISSGLWCIPNSIALLLLTNEFMKIYYDFEEKYININKKKAYKGKKIKRNLSI